MGSGRTDGPPGLLLVDHVATTGGADGERPTSRCSRRATALLLLRRLPLERLAHRARHPIGARYSCVRLSRAFRTTGTAHARERCFTRGKTCTQAA